MEILCPNCQKKLTIPEQYAGQMMRCPMCSGTFTAPALPPTPSLPSAEAYAVQPPPPPPPPEAPGTAAADVGTTPAGSVPSGPVPTEHTGRFSVWISPQVTQYIPAVLLFLVFILTFFTWVGIRPGGVWLDSQTAWQVMFGRPSSPDKVTEALSWFRGAKREKEPLPQPLAGEAAHPGFGFFMFVYLFLLVVNVGVVVVAAGHHYLKEVLPANLYNYLNWRWPAAALLTFVSFAVLLLQNSVGFPLERSAHDAVDKVATKFESDWTKMQRKGDFGENVDPKEIPIEAAIFRGTNEQAIVRSSAYRYAFWFHFLALVFVLLTMLAYLRAPRPCPRVDVMW
jgi:hypothetical protein